MRRRSWNRNQPVAGPTRVLSPSPTRRARSPRRDTHVEVCGAVLSDAGSTPAASTTRATRRARCVADVVSSTAPVLWTSPFESTPVALHCKCPGASRGAFASLGDGSPLARRASRGRLSVRSPSLRRLEPVDQSTHYSAFARLPFLRRRRSRVQRQHRAGGHLHAVPEVRRSVERRALRAASGSGRPAVRRLALTIRSTGLTFPV